MVMHIAMPCSLRANRHSCAGRCVHSEGGGVATAAVSDLASSGLSARFCRTRGRALRAAGRPAATASSACFTMVLHRRKKETSSRKRQGKVRVCVRWVCECVWMIECASACALRVR